MAHPISRVWQGTLLIAGTTIGGGVLALPVLTALSGFIPSVVLFISCWALMMCTGLLALEAYMWSDEEDPNLISMAERTLGKFGKIFTWVIYIFFFYCLTLAYTKACGKLLVSALGLSLWVGPILFLALFVPFVYAGIRVIGRLNVPLMIGLIGSYVTFLVIGYQYVDFENLKACDWGSATLALPVAFASFGFHGTIPSLGRYLEKNVSQARLSIILGSLIPLVFYLIWEWLILGILPVEGPGGLAEALQNDQTAVEPLKDFLHNPSVYIVGQFFSFFALLTSFLGVTLGLRDFLADGLGIEKDSKGKLFICALIFVPVLIFTLTFPNIFLFALDVAGGFGAALLLGLLPIMMVWSGRYRLGLPKQDKALPGGKPLLVILALFVVFEVIVEVMKL